LNAKLEGIKEFLIAVQQINEQVNKAAHETSMKQGNLLARRIRGNINRGPRGNLSRAVKVKAMSGGYPVIVGMDRKIAPHAHLVEFGGTFERYPSGSPHYVDRWGKKVYSKNAKALTTGQGLRARARAMPPQKYFRRALDESQDIPYHMAEDIKRAIER
jgi:hypothetical protein